MATEQTTRCQHFVECDLCQQPVSFLCRRCGVNLCDTCVPVHLRVKSITGHDVVHFTSRDSDGTVLCDVHPINDCCAFCKTCDIPICFICLSVQHKSHEISELSEKIEELKKENKDEELVKLIKKENGRIQSTKQDLEKILNHTTKQLSWLPLNYKKKQEEVTARGEEWRRLIDETVKTLHEELDDMQKEHEDVLQKQKKEFEEMIEKIEEINKKAKSLQESKNVFEMEKFLQIIKKYESIKEFSQYLFPTFYKCEIDEKYLQTYFGYTEKMQEKKIPVIEYQLRDNELSGRKILDAPTVTSVIDTGFPPNEINNRLFDMANTDDNKVWMGGHSKELKLFDVQGLLYRTVRITCSGMHMCMYNKQVVYTDYVDFSVKMISDTDTVVTMFTTGEWLPRGVTSSASGDLLVCLRKDDQNKIVRYNSTGTVLQEIQYDSQCQPLYKQASCITENVNGDIILTEWKKNAVIAVDRLGLFRFSYSSKDSKFKALSVATDSVGHIFVTGGLDHKIHMLDIDGRFLRYIMPEGGMKHPRAVCVLGNGELMVGECISGIAKRIQYL